MDLRFTPEEIAFRDEVRTFFRTQIPAEIRRKVREGRKLDEGGLRAQPAHAERTRLGRAALAEGVGRAGLVARCRPTSFRRSCSKRRCRRSLSFNVFMVGPVIAAFGSEEQKRRFLPRMANLDDWWCQGFSEPGAGSDLAVAEDARRGARATTTSSTARRPGRRSASTPTGSSAWCAPIPPPRSNTASASC